VADSALKRSLRIEKDLRDDDRVRDCEVTLVETPESEHHIAKVLLTPTAEIIELKLDSVPIPEEVHKLNSR
jgi:hypothetical protein